MRLHLIEAGVRKASPDEWLTIWTALFETTDLDT